MDGDGARRKSKGDSDKERTMRSDDLSYNRLVECGVCFCCPSEHHLFLKKRVNNGVDPIACLAPSELRLAPHTTNKQGLFSPLFSLQDRDGKHAGEKRKRKCKSWCMWRSTRSICEQMAPYLPCCCM